MVASSREDAVQQAIAAAAKMRARALNQGFLIELAGISGLFVAPGVIGPHLYMSNYIYNYNRIYNIIK